MSRIALDHDGSRTLVADDATLWTYAPGAAGIARSFDGPIASVAFGGPNVALVTHAGSLHWPDRHQLALGMEASEISVRADGSAAVAHPQHVTLTRPGDLAPTVLSIPDASSLAWAADGQSLAIGTNQGLVFEVLVGSAVEVQAPWQMGARVSAIAAMPRGGFVVAAGEHVHLLASRRGLAGSLAPLGRPTRRVRVSSTGDIAILLATGPSSPGGDLITLHASTGHPLAVSLKTGPDAIADFAYAGSTLAVLFRDGSAARIDTRTRTTTPLPRSAPSAVPAVELWMGGAAVALTTTPLAVPGPGMNTGPLAAPASAPGVAPAASAPGVAPVSAAASAMAAAPAMATSAPAATPPASGGTSAPAGLPRHDRSAPLPDDDFLAPIDPRIGKPLSGYTNRSIHGWHPTPKAERNQYIGIGCLVSFIGGLLTFLLSQSLARSLFYGNISEFEFLLRQYLPPVLGGLVFFLVGPLCAAWAWLLRAKVATVVGTGGLFRHRVGALFGPRTETLAFEDTDSLNVSRTRHFRNGVYTGTSYTYRFHRKSGSPFVISGSYHDTKRPPSEDQVHFAHAAEAAWSNWRVREVDENIKKNGIHVFQVGTNSIGVGPRLLEIMWQGKSVRLPVSEIEQLYFEQGTLVIRKRGATESFLGLFGSDGVFRFSVQQMNDFQIFLIILSEQTGFKFQ